MATRMGTKSQITQQVRGCVSLKLLLYFSKPINFDPTLHCNPCSPARGSLQYETMSQTWYDPATGAALRNVARLTRSPQSHRTNASSAFAR